MKSHLSRLSLLALSGLLWAGCNGSTNSTTEKIVDTVAKKVDTAMSRVKEGAEKVVTEAKESMNENADSAFVVKAARTTITELKILQAGVDKGTDKDLKAHARMMIADHKKLGAKVKDYATAKGYKLPDTDDGKGDDEVTKLDKNTKGKDWDKAWADHMVSAHEDAIKMFEKRQGDTKDEALKKVIDGGLPTLRSHLDMMKQLQSKLSK